MATRSPVLNVMIRAADRAARGLKRDFGEVSQLQVSRKGPGDFVSTADLKAEQVLRQELHRARPDFGFLMEESGASGDASAECRWIVDPLDGTINFLHGLPHFAISIGLEVRGEIAAGVIYDPVKNELFYAEKGSGAYLNDRRIRVSGRERLAESLLATGIPSRARGGLEQYQAELRMILDCGAGVRRWGAAALDLAYVAAGRYEGAWERKLSPWDIAAGIVLVREAGGYVSEIEGRAVRLDSASIVAATDGLFDEIRKLLNTADATSHLD